MSGLQVDMMATPYNAKIREFICPFEHPKASGVDMRVQDWNQWQRVYVFTPGTMLEEVMTKISSFQGIAGKQTSDEFRK